MKTETTEITLAECLNFSNYPKLPPILGKENANWLYAICLVQRLSTEEDYVIVRNYGDSISPIRSFTKGSSLIVKYKEIYPYEFYDKEAIPELNTIRKVALYLSNYYDAKLYTNEDGTYDKEVMKKLIAKKTIESFIKTRTGLNRLRYVPPKPIEIEVDNCDDKKINKKDENGKESKKSKG